jgi:hypothetical protein
VIDENDFIKPTTYPTMNIFKPDHLQNKKPSLFQQ